MDAVCLYVQHSSTTYSPFFFLSSPSSSPPFPSVSLPLYLSLFLKHIFLLAVALSHKHARTYLWQKRDVGMKCMS